MMLRSIVRVSVMVLLLAAAPAYAYRNPDRFAAPVAEGGGAGKYFTLSRAEGYGCAVCHSQGSTIPVQVLNLPRAGYVPGQPYRLTVDWPDDMPSVALNVELTDYAGAPLGQLVAPDPSTLTVSDLCRESESPSAGQTLTQDPSGRQVLLVAECGQAQTSFDWIAPLTQQKGYFSTSILFGNRDGKLAGDSVVDISEPLQAQGVAAETPPAANTYQTQGACNIVSAHSSTLPASMLCSCVCLLSWRVRKRKSVQLLLTSHEDESY